MDLKVMQENQEEVECTVFQGNYLTRGVAGLEINRKFILQPKWFAGSSRSKGWKRVARSHWVTWPSWL